MLGIILLLAAYVILEAADDIARHRTLARAKRRAMQAGWTWMG